MAQSIRHVVIAACDPFSRNTTVEERFGPYLRKQDCCTMAITVDSYGRISSSICSSIASCLVVGFAHLQYVDGASIAGGTAFVAIKSTVVMAASDTH